MKNTFKLATFNSELKITMKIMPKTIVVASIFTWSVLQSEVPMKLPELLSYKDVTITKVEVDHIRIIHKEGSRKILLEELPEDLRIKFGYSKEKA